jgi:hypothetical protein
MNTVTPEEANEGMRQWLEEEESQAQSHLPEDSPPWEQKQPLSWPDFLASLVRYCNARQWQVIFDSVDDLAVTIFAHQDPVVTGAEARQERLSFGDEEDGLPF